MQPKDQKQPLHPDHVKLLQSKEFQRLRGKLTNYRQALFETGESDSELITIGEKRGKRKMLAILLDETSLDALFNDKY